ncbi:MAG: sensor histidine kinase [Leptospirales bacterium]
MNTHIRIQSMMILIVGILIFCLMGAFAVWDNLLVRKDVIATLRNEGRLVGQEFAFGVDMRHEADRFVGGRLGNTEQSSAAFVNEIGSLRKEMRAVMTLRHNVTRVDLMTRHEGLPRLVTSKGSPLSEAELNAHTLVHSGQKKWLSISEKRNGRESLYVVVPFYHRSQRLGTVGIRISLYEANILVRKELERTLLLLFLGFLSIAAALSFVIQQLILNPVYRMSEAMARVGDGNLDQKLLLKGSREVTDLAQSFNTMVRMLSDRTQENSRLLKRVQELNDSLTQRVKEATQELLQKNESLESAGREMFFLQRRLSEMERMAAIGEGLAIVAHELGNPLHSISGHIELALEEKNLASSISKHLTIVQEQLDRMIKVIRKLLTMSRREQTHTEPVSISNLISDMLHLLAPRLEKSGIFLETSYPDPCPMINSNQDGLQSILINFLENALDATGPGGKISIRCVLEDSFLSMHIQDSGPGVPEERRDQIFEPFFTTKPHGTGLGLAICRKIIDDLGGDVHLGNGPGGHFILRIPFDRFPLNLSSPVSLEQNH